MRIGIVAGEPSGDFLAAGLIQALRRYNKDIKIEGIAGPQMIAAGCTPLFPMDALSVMGLTEVLKRLPQIFQLRRQLIKHFLANPPDVFIGVDAPDFNLGVELKLRSAGIPTVHYHSPSVWAWKAKRIKKIARATNLMLTLFPFETAIYEEHQIPVRYVGHPLADLISSQTSKSSAREALHLPTAPRMLALLPGSRSNELTALAELFIQTAKWCVARHPDLLLVVPVVNAARRRQLEKIWRETAPELPLHIVEGGSRTVMAAADVILLASGTATLEAMLSQKPMVVAYRLAPLTYWLAKRLVKIKHFSLPNLLAGKALVPEFLQEAATPEALGHAVLDRLEHPENFEDLLMEYEKIHTQLRCNASEQAAMAVLELASSCK